jgi:hypothetical protein
MKVSQMLPSTYLKKDDIENPVIVTIDHLEETNVAAMGQPEEKKWVIFFSEYDKGMVLNSTNIHSIVASTGCGDTDDWPGKEVVLYNDPTVSYAGKVTGGLRIRAKQQAPVRPAARTGSPLRARPTDPIPAWVTEEVPPSDVPF